MAEERMHLLDAQERASELLSTIDEAVASRNADEMRHHVEAALNVGQIMQDRLEEALSVTEDLDMADQVEESMHHLNMAMDQGEQALDATDEEAEECVLEMRKHGQQSNLYLRQVLGIGV